MCLLWPDNDSVPSPKQVAADIAGYSSVLLENLAGLRRHTITEDLKRGRGFGKCFATMSMGENKRVSSPTVNIIKKLKMKQYNTLNIALIVLFFLQFFSKVKDQTVREKDRKG